MPQAIERRAFKNVLIGALSFTVTGLGNFIAVPICLREWGAPRYGAWLALLAGFLMLRTIDGGFSNYVGNEINVKYHADRGAMRRTLASAFMVCAILGCVQCAVLLALALTDTVQSFLGLDSSGDNSTAALAVLVGGWVASGLFIGVVHRLLIPIGRLYEATWWFIALQALQLLGLIASARLHLTLLQTAWVYTALQTAVYLCSAWYIARIAPEFFPWWHQPSSRQARTDFGRSMLLTCIGGIQQATVSGTVLLVAKLFGASAVPVFTSVRTLANVWVTLAGAITNPLQPDIVRFHGTEQSDKLVKVIKAIWYFGGFIGNATILAFMPLSEPLYRLWTGRTLEFDPRLLMSSFAAVSMAAFGTSISTYLSGINSVRPQLVTNITRAVVLFGLTAGLSGVAGLASIAIAMWVAEFLCSVVLTLYFLDLQLAESSAKLDVKDVVPGLLMIVPLQLTALYGVILGHISVCLCAAALIVQLVLAFWGWRVLDAEVKQRVRALLPLRAT